jgi:gamma-glutamylaminecyclotransferase
MEVNNMPYLFAHGILKTGGRNNNLISSSVLLGNAVTEQDYALYTVNNKPLVTRLPKTRIKGEVYAVSDDTLTLVDRFEGHPRINKRDLVTVKLEDGNTVEAWLYFHIQPLRESVLIESGEYTDFKL